LKVKIQKNSQHTLAEKILPDDFHDRAIDAQAVSIDEDKYLAHKITSLVKEAGVKYAYTIIKHDGHISRVV